VKKLFLPISIGILCASFTIIPAPTEYFSDTGSVVNAPGLSIDPNESSTDAYCSANLQQYGLSEEAFAYAWKGYQDLLVKKSILRSEYLTICDMSQSSAKKRLYVIDMNENKLIINTYVAHGRNSGREYASSFSNSPASLQSSLGFYITQSTYIGGHGLSLRINGLEPGINDKALERTIVIHGAAYVDEARAKRGIFMGRSFGCPAVPVNESAKIITTIKNGTCLFIYHPSRNYLLKSKILNG
jgi:hypothetical protein